MSSIYITTSIPYVNSRPHIGHALELIQADLLARYYRLKGEEVQFQTGTDENAFKNVLAARAQGASTQEFVDRNAGIFRSLVSALKISADEFIRTTEKRHHDGVVALWERFNSEDLYSKSYEGLYCVGCEDFYLDKDLVGGLCPDHGVPPKKVEEQNIFFKLSVYQRKLEQLIESDRLRVVPEKRKNEVLSFIRGGLQDISISRSSERSGGWGISVPGDPSQVIYVWIDALINYVSGQGFGSDDRWKSVWSERNRKAHVVGKNVWKFHAVYWPALLLSAKLPLPDEIFVHGFLTENGRKISKSLGNAIDPFDYAAKFGADGLRHYLLRAVSPFDDGDFTSDRIAAVYESELANGLGNLVSRVTSLCEKADYGKFEEVSIPQEPSGLSSAIQDYRLSDAAQAIWTIVDGLNQDVARIKPWELLKTGNREELRGHLTRWLTGIFQVGYWIQPFLPETGQTILRLLSGREVKAATPLFPRIISPH